MNLLSVLNPVAGAASGDSSSQSAASSVEEDIDRAQCVVMATRGITALLVQSLQRPRAGDPTASRLDYGCRDKPLQFLQSRLV